MHLGEITSDTKLRTSLKVLSRNFASNLDFSAVSFEHASVMLKKTQILIKEIMHSSSAYKSEKNPSYLQLIIMEQALKAKLNELEEVPGVELKNVASGAQKLLKMPGLKPGTTSAQLAAALADTTAGKSASGASKDALGGLTQNLQKALADPDKSAKLQQLLMSKQHTSTSQVMESEIETAQVVLSAQDMIDRIQKMIEDIAEMQYKDLPNLIAVMRNQIGVNEAQTYMDAQTQTITTLVQSLQTAKAEMDITISPLTGQELPQSDPFSTGQADDSNAPASDIELPTEELPEPTEELPEPTEELPDTNLGRKKR